MNRRTVLLIGLQLCLLLLLAGLGAYNQQRHQRHRELIRHKELLYAQRSDLRRRAATIIGPAAVRAWARSEGMVPTPEGRPASNVAHLSPPSMSLPELGLEIGTSWR